MNQPLVSVIIVCFNHSKFVLECLDSLLKQKFKNWELIIADDASSDNSVEIISTWLNENKVVAKTIFHKKNIGLVKTLNECIDLSKGRYIKIIAADDIMLPDLLSDMVERFESLTPDYQLIYTNANYIDENGNIGESLLDLNFDFNRDKIEEMLFKDNFILAPTSMFKSSIYSLVGKYNEDFVIEDYEFSLRLSKKFKIDYIPKILGLYRIHSNNISKKIDLDEEIVRIKIYYDTDGKYSEVILNNILELYRKGNITKKIREAYTGYKGKSNGLAFFLKYKLPYKLYKLKNFVIYRKYLR